MTYPDRPLFMESAEPDSGILDSLDRRILAAINGAPGELCAAEIAGLIGEPTERIFVVLNRAFNHSLSGRCRCSTGGRVSDFSQFRKLEGANV